METKIVKLTRGGVSRVLNGEVGMTFVVDHFTNSLSQGQLKVAHVRDYRYAVQPLGYQLWSLPPQAYEEIRQ